MKVLTCCEYKEFYDGKASGGEEEVGKVWARNQVGTVLI